MDYLLGHQGPLNAELVGEMSGRIKAIMEMAELPFDAIAKFYQPEDENAA